VGFGLRAAAAEYRLAFVPLVRERYFFAVHARDVQNPAINRLVEVLRSAAFGRIVRALPGYRSAAAGSVVGLEALSAPGEGKREKGANGRTRTAAA
jgi:molybdate-binding protein